MSGGPRGERTARDGKNRPSPGFWRRDPATLRRSQHRTTIWGPRDILVHHRPLYARITQASEHTHEHAGAIGEKVGTLRGDRHRPGGAARLMPAGAAGPTSGDRRGG
ncbi:hypothetical protein NDU88_000644 [Pleurodeles waltl]|uniref:Uncharacterized protein n=1 Tax=Pleurodeles waltl TaxID=8319 RepID=A0AAV7L8R3_PLEWA|nr:hypothetical protein NDU88_000644 [Pleurodeles waltl]